ncbi:hypothetical protein HispidOSU_016892, partial [Sigmodon hispidus]
GSSGRIAQQLEQKHQEIREDPGASRRVSQGFPRRVLLVATGLWTPSPIQLCESQAQRQVGVEPGPKQQSEPAEGGSPRGVGGARSPAPGPRPEHRGRCSLRSAQLP